MPILNYTFLCIICHYFGEYALQPERIRLWKHKEKHTMFAHMMVYIFPFYVAFGFGFELPVLMIAHYILESKLVHEKYVALWMSCISILLYVIRAYI